MNTCFLNAPTTNVELWMIDHAPPNPAKPLCFTAFDAGAEIMLMCIGNNLQSARFEVSTDGTTWSDYEYETFITLPNVCSRVYFKAKTDNSHVVRDTANYLMFVTPKYEKHMSVSGNVMSLLTPQFKNQTTIYDYQFYALFGNCKSIKTSSALSTPATYLASWCYASMFQNCTSLTQAPALPATSLISCCYASMFQNCTSLTQAPALPATLLDFYCYSNMFNGCTALKTAPALPATSLDNGCYHHMFYGCTKFSQCHMKASMEGVYIPNVHGDTTKTVIFDL